MAENMFTPKLVIECNHLTLKDRSTIERALGIVEGVSYIVEGDGATALLDAVDMIDKVLNKEVKENAEEKL